MTKSRPPERFDHHRGRAPLLRPTHLWQQAVFLAANLAAFTVVCAFWQYLSTGRWVDFSPSAYRRVLATGAGQMLLEPLSVFRYPWMMLVSGLVMSALVVVPVMVSVLYRLPFAGVFLLVVAAVGHAPVLALTIGVGCILATRTTLRSDMPFLAVLLGLLPVAVYTMFAFLAVASTATLPLQHWVLMAPFLTALVASVVGAGAVLVLARATGFRPGVVLPVMLVLVGVPVAVFHAKVGPDELEYSLITGSLPPGQSILGQSSLDEWTRRHDAGYLTGPKLIDRVRSDLQRRRRDLVARGRAFLWRHPRSRHAPAIAWLVAQCHSLQLDGPALSNGRIRHVTRHLADTEECREAWARLGEQYPDSSQAGLADWHLGEFALRSKDTSGALERLASARARLKYLVARPGNTDRADRQGRIFLPVSRLPADEYYRKALFEVEYLIWLATENIDAPEALAAYLSTNPHKNQFAKRLAQLAEQYQDTSMGDNFKLAEAMATHTEDPYLRSAALIKLARMTEPDKRAVEPGARRPTDAAIEANYELARLALLTKDSPALPLVLEYQKPQIYFRQVLSARENPWRGRSVESLAWLAATGAPRQGPRADESEYSELVGALAPGQAIFEPEFLDKWAGKNGATGLSRQGQEARVREDLKSRKLELVQRCEAFLDSFPTSPRRPEVAWLAAQCHSVQLDEPALRGGLIRYDSSFLLDTAESQQAWRRLAEDFPTSPQSALAQWHLGRLAIRRGDVSEAAERLHDASERLEAILASTEANPSGAPASAAPAGIPPRNHYRQALLATRRLIWLMNENTEAIEALAELCGTNPLKLKYYQSLCSLARQWEATSLGDNLKLAVALADDDDYRRAAALILLAKARPPSDAAIEAMYELGRLAPRTVYAPALALVEGLREPKWYFQRVRDARTNPWQSLAAEHLARLTTTQPKTPVAHDERDYADLLNAIESPQTLYEPAILDVWARSVGLEDLSSPRRRMRVRIDLEGRQHDLIVRCEKFLADHARSKHAAKVLWIAAQAHNLQLDERDLKVGLIRYRTDFALKVEPVTAIYRRLLKEHAKSPQSALARWRLGQLAARANKMQEAYKHLSGTAAALEKAARAAEAASAKGAGDGVLRPSSPVPSARTYGQGLFETRRLIWLMKQNKVLEDADSARALAQYLNTDPCKLKYSQQLQKLAGKYERTHMGDNLKLAVALAGNDDFERAAAMILLTRSRPLTDAGVQACYELGWLAMRKAELPGAGGVDALKGPWWYFRQVQSARGNPWQKLASDLLDRLKATSRPGQKP